MLWIFYLLAGLGAGVVTGLAGLSAAVVITPVLVSLCGWASYDAVTVALAADVLASLLSAYTYYKNKNIDLKTGGLVTITAFLGTVIGIMTARATELYGFRGREAVYHLTFLPLLVPGTVFAMGIQITLIRLGLSDTVMGVVLVHLIAAVPYCITIMTDVTRAVGKKLEEQAMVLGADPWQAFFAVSLPSLLPGILSSMSMGFILSYSQYFTTLMVGGGRVKTIALVLVPYIQSGDRSLSAAYSVAFVGSALAVFFVFETMIHNYQKRGESR